MPSPSISTVFFDLDGTLIHYVSIERARSYYGEFSRFVQSHLDIDDVYAEKLLQTALGAMFKPHPHLTNQQAFDAEYMQLLNSESDKRRYKELFSEFFEQVYFGIRSNETPAPYNREVIIACREAGLTPHIASQPIFCKAAIKARLDWANLGDLTIPLASSSETAFFVKPTLEYYLEIAHAVGARPHECLMVGNEDRSDMTASQVGMRTFYVGDEPTGAAGNLWTGSGTLVDLINELPRLIA